MSCITAHHTAALKQKVASFQFSAWIRSHLCESHEEELVVGQVDGRKPLLLAVLFHPGTVSLHTGGPEPLQRLPDSHQCLHSEFASLEVHVLRF